MPTNVNRNKIPIIDEISKHCTVCNKVYKSRDSYKLHLYKIHGISLPRLRPKAMQIEHDVIPDMNDKNNYCVSCKRTYSNRVLCTHHLSDIHNMKN